MTLDLAPFKTLIRERCGLTFEDAGEARLAMAVEGRLQALSAGPAAYYLRLQGSAEEFQALVNLLTINETYFFRDPEQIRLFSEGLAPRLLARRGDGGPVRVLSAGCSSGEEPYSLAMALLDRYGESAQRLFEVVGGDLDAQALDKGRAGLYARFSFRGVPADVQARHFEPRGALLQVRERVRRMVRLCPLNLLFTEPAAGLGVFDVVFFRNVSIYFDAPTRGAILRNLVGLMADDAFLLLGSSETLANDLGVLPLYEDGGQFYFVKGHPPLAPGAGPAGGLGLGARSGIRSGLQRTQSNAAGESHPGSLGAPGTALPPGTIHGAPANPAIQPPKDGEPGSAPEPDLAEARRLIVERLYDAALAPLDRVLGRDAGHLEALVLKAHALINRQEYAVAEGLLHRVLARDAWSVDACLLLGLAGKWQGQRVAAIHWLRQAVYAHHECWPAHYYLAELYRLQGEVAPARRAYRLVLHQLTAPGPGSGLRYLPLELPPREVRFLCEHQLARLPHERP